MSFVKSTPDVSIQAGHLKASLLIKRVMLLNWALLDEGLVQCYCYGNDTIIKKVRRTLELRVMENRALLQ
jgi:hypothetical protein